MLTVYIRDKKKIHFFGKAHTITSSNEVGEFDILESHANLTTLIKDYIVIDKNLPSEQKLVLKTGILSVRRDVVKVFLGL